MTTSSRLEHLFTLARAARGFMPDDEGLALFAAGEEAARRAAHDEGPVVLLEVGSWCGKSATYLGAAAEAAGAVLITVDHHHGSEENQVGWEHFDADLVDPSDGRLNTLPHLQRQLAVAELEHTVVAVVGHSTEVARWWTTPLALVFIDGGHGEAPAWADYRSWTPKLRRGGLLAIHDVFEDPAQGGRPPYELYCEALSSGEFVDWAACGSLRVVERR